MKKVFSFSLVLFSQMALIGLSWAFLLSSNSFLQMASTDFLKSQEQCQEACRDRKEAVLGQQFKEIQKELSDETYKEFMTQTEKGYDDACLGALSSHCHEPWISFFKKRLLPTTTIGLSFNALGGLFLLLLFALVFRGHADSKARSKILPALYVLSVVQLEITSLSSITMNPLLAGLILVGLFYAKKKGGDAKRTYFYLLFAGALSSLLVEALLFCSIVFFSFGPHSIEGLAPKALQEGCFGGMAFLIYGLSFFFIKRYKDPLLKAKEPFFLKTFVCFLTAFKQNFLYNAFLLSLAATLPQEFLMIGRTGLFLVWLFLSLPVLLPSTSRFLERVKDIKKGMTDQTIPGRGFSAYSPD